MNMKRDEKKINASTSWESVEKWYHGTVGEEGHYYHQKIVIPGLIKLLNLNGSKDPLILDLACGQGVLSRQLPSISYVGLDISPSLIKSAKSLNKVKNHEFLVADATKQLPLQRNDFSHATIVLALQNIEHPQSVFKNAFKHLRPNGKFIIIINHPCFRIPRQSSWKVDEEQKIQYRRMDRYMSEMSIPIHTNPSQGQSSSNTVSFHHPLSAYSRWLQECGFLINILEEWCSDKVSTGKNAKMENRSREEFPLFLAICAEKRA
jgi:ubiquinone/menaquinone biosynthesis C-methylase UbiE